MAAYLPYGRARCGGVVARLMLLSTAQSAVACNNKELAHSNKRKTSGSGYLIPARPGVLSLLPGWASPPGCAPTAPGADTGRARLS